MRDFDEMRNIDLEYEPMVIYKKKGGFFGKFVSLLLGIILGVVAGLGGVAGIGWYAYAKMKIADGVGMVNDTAGMEIDYSKYIDGSYGEQTIKDLVGDVIEAAEKISNSEGTLNDLNAISPLVKELLAGDGTEENQGLVGMLAAYAVEIDPEEAMKRIIVKPAGTPDSEENKDIYLVDYIRYCIDSAPVGDMLQAFGYEVSDVIHTVCYGVEGVNYIYDENGEMQMINGSTKMTVGDFLGEKLDDQIQLLPIDSFVKISFPSDKVMCMLAYGPEHRYEKELDENGDVVMKQVFYTYDETAGFALYDDMGEDVTMNITSDVSDPKTNGVVLTHTYTQNDVEVTETRYLQYDADEDKFYSFDDEAYTIPTKFRKNTIESLNDGSDKLLESLYIKDLLDIDASDTRVMVALAYGKEGTDWEKDDTAEDGVKMLNGAKPRTLKDLKDNGGNLFNTLTLKDVLGEENVEENMILHSLADTTIEGLPAAMNELTFADIFSEQIYVYETDASGNKVPVYKTDADGNFILDENGNKIQEISALWNYLFNDPNDEEHNSPEEYYLLGHTTDHPGVDHMVENMQANMQLATLGDLVEDGLIVFENDTDGAKKQDFLTDTNQKQLPVTQDDGTTKLKYIRDMTIVQMLNYIINDA